MENAEQVQYRAVLDILVLERELIELNFLRNLGGSLDDRFSRCILRLHKIVSSNNPTYLSSILPDTVELWNQVIDHFNDLPFQRIVKDISYLSSGLPINQFLACTNRLDFGFYFN